jgi:hypothetical protein
MRKPSLQLGHTKKAQIGSMEKSNSKRKPDAHDEVLDIVCDQDRHRCANWVDDLREDPVHMEKNYAAK